MSNSAISEIEECAGAEPSWLERAGERPVARAREGRRGICIGALIWAFVLALALASCQSPATTVIVLRHAERGPGSDPALTPAGEQRAQALVGVADAAVVTGIYASQFQRTQQTVAPLAEHLALTVRVVPVGNDVAQYAASLAAQVLAENEGSTAVVASHSNIVPEIVAALGAGSVQVGEQDFDRLFVVTVPEKGAVRLVRATYGD